MVDHVKSKNNNNHEKRQRSKRSETIRVKQALLSTSLCISISIRLDDEAKKGLSERQPNVCWTEEGPFPLNLANAQGDEGDAEASREHAHLRHLEVLQGGSEMNECMYGWTDQ